MVARHELAALVGLHRLQKARGVVVLRGQEQFGVVQLGLRPQPRGMYTHAERQPRVRRSHVERLGDGLRIARGQDDGRHADALQYADRRAHIRAVRHAALVVLDRDLRDHRPPGDVAQREHRRPERCKGLRAAQIIKRSVVMQQRTERPLAPADIIHRHRPLTLVLIRDGRTFEHQPDRERVQTARPLCAGGAVRRDRAREALGRLPVQRQVVRVVQENLRCMIQLT